MKLRRQLFIYGLCLALCIALFAIGACSGSDGGLKSITPPGDGGSGGGDAMLATAAQLGNLNLTIITQETPAQADEVYLGKVSIKPGSMI